MYIKNIKVLSVVLFIGVIFSQSYFNRILGDDIYPISGRAYGMAKTAMMSDNSSALGLSNPAGLLKLNGFNIDVSTNIMRVKERRSIPVQDFFGDYLVDANYVTNGNYFNYNRIGVSYSNLSILPISLAISQGQYLTSDYLFNEEVRDIGSSFYKDPLVGYHKFETSGTLNLLTCSMATSFTNLFSIGFSQNVILPTTFTAIRDTVILETSDFIASEQEFSFNSETNNTYFAVLSSEIKLGNESRLALAYEQSATVEYEDSLVILQNDTFGLPQFAVDTVHVNNSLVKPEKYRIGWSFSPSQKINTTFVLEYEKVKYSSVAIDSLELIDTDTYKIGFEYMVNNKFPIRAGLIHKTSPYRKDLTESIFTFGFGKSIGKISYDIGGEYGSLSYSYFDIFQPENDPSNPSGIEKVMESHFNILLSVKYKF